MPFTWDSLRAITSIGTMFRNRSDYGVVDVFNQYPLLDVLASIMAIANLQNIVLADELSKVSETEWKNENIGTLRDLTHYANFSHAVYGWNVKGDTEGELNPNDLHKLLIRTGLREVDVVMTRWQAQTHRPVFFIVRERLLQRLVLCIRGTYSTHDVLTDLCCVAVDFETVAGGRHRAHEGILKSARSLEALTDAIIAHELEQNPDLSLVLTGHSLGGGVAAVLGTLWETRFPGLKVYCYGTPCVSPLDSALTIDNHIISVIAAGDPFASLSLGHVADASMAIAYLCQNSQLRNAILLRTGIAPDRRSVEDLCWFYVTLSEIRLQMTSEKMLPPGRIIYLQENTDRTVSSKEPKKDFFNDPRVHIGMLDFTKHVPSVYETLLAILCAEVEDKVDLGA